MTLTNGQRIDRLIKRLIELDQWIVRQSQALDQWTFDGAPIELGERWPTRQGVVLFRHPEISVASDWPLDRTFLSLDVGGEGLLRIDFGGTSEGFGLDPNHRRFSLQARTFSVSAECVARLPFGVPNRDAHLREARLIWLETELAEFALLLRQLSETAHELGGHEAVDPLLTVAEKAFRAVEWPTATDTYVARMAPSAEMQKVWELPSGLSETPEGLGEASRASVVAATEELTGALRALRDRYPQNGALAMTGHAHIDLAWLWPLDETRRKATRTFHTMIGLMERYPDFLFNQSTAALYDFLETDDPALFQMVKEKVAGGQWEPIGAMWVEPDTNMPTGESFVRQLLYGQRYFERTFGRRHTVCWLPDCFGFSPAFPQLLRQAGVEYFFTIKVNWSETNAMPFDLFWWEGLDGSRVLAHTFKNPVGGYNAETGPRSILETWKNFRGKHHYPESLLAFGYGDGGGGPTVEMLERQRQLDDFPAVPSLRPVKVADWFASAKEKVSGDETLPVWVGEMYLELHRGTLTTQGRTKYLHRRAERALIAAEVLGSMVMLLGAPKPASLEQQWRLVLRNEFHDVLPGSSIREVYEQAEAELGSVIAATEKVIDKQLAALSGKLADSGSKSGVLVVNPDLSPRPLRIETGHDLPNAQAVEGGMVFAGSRNIQGMSAAVILKDIPPEGLSVAADRLENAFLRVAVAEDGTLTSVFDKITGREALAGRGNQIWAYVDKPRNWDAWDVEDDYAQMGEEVVAESSTIIERGPHRAAIRTVRSFRDSEIVQTIRLWANSARLEFKTDIDWHDRRVLLKARFPLAIRSNEAVFECAHGVVRRPTHRNTSWEQARFEVAGHRFVDLAEHGYGVALLNDGKYGHHALGNELGLTLLRSPIFPDPLADEGRQGFVYAIYPHRGDWLSGGVLAEAEDLNQPLLCRRVEAKSESTWTAVQIAGPQLALSALKPAEDADGLVLRTWEPAGGRGRVTVMLPENWSVGAELNLLEDAAGPAGLDILPFKVQSWAINRN